MQYAAQTSSRDRRRAGQSRWTVNLAAQLAGYGFTGLRQQAAE